MQNNNELPEREYREILESAKDWKLAEDILHNLGKISLVKWTDEVMIRIDIPDDEFYDYEDFREEITDSSKIIYDKGNGLYLNSVVTEEDYISAYNFLVLQDDKEDRMADERWEDDYDIVEICQRARDKEPWVKEIAAKGNKATALELQRVAKDFISSYRHSIEEEITLHEVLEVLETIRQNNP